MTNKTNWPIGFSQCNKFYSTKGNFYHMVDEDNQHWKQVECYLPGDVGTLGESLESTMNRRLEEFSTGKREAKRALTDSGNYKQKKFHFGNGKFQLVNKPTL